MSSRPHSIPPALTPTVPVTNTVNTVNTNTPTTNQLPPQPDSHHTMLSPSAVACTTSLLKNVEKNLEKEDEEKEETVQNINTSASIPSTEGVEEKGKLEVLKTSSCEIGETNTDALLSTNECDLDSFVLDKSYLEDVLKIEACLKLSKETQELTQEEVDFIRAVDGRK